MFITPQTRKKAHADIKVDIDGASVIS